MNKFEQGIVDGVVESMSEPDDVRSALADDERVIRQFFNDGADSNRSRKALDRIMAALRSASISDKTPIEVWHGSRKVTIYKDAVMRIWGTDIEDEMTSEQRNLKTTQAAFDWLFATDSNGPEKYSDLLNPVVDPRNDIE